MIPTVLDANVLVSGFSAAKGTAAEVLQRGLRRRYHLITSEHIIAAMLRAWERPYWRARFLPSQRLRAVAILRARATIVTPVSTVRGVAKHEEDDVVLATAVAGRAAYLVTGDYGLQQLRTFPGIKIVSPSDFLSVLEEQETTQE